MRPLSESFGFLRGNVLVLIVSGSLGMFCRAMVFPYVPLYILALGGEPEQIGIVYALGPLGGLIAFPIAGLTGGLALFAPFWCRSRSCGIQKRRRNSY